MIGRAKEGDGLYYLDTLSNLSFSKGKSSVSFLSECYSSNKEKIWLHHRRLGHPSFNTLKILFPSLFKGLDIEFFRCDVCEFAKHKRVPFPISNKRSSVPFCWKLHGKPPSKDWGDKGGQHRSSGQAHVTTLQNYEHTTQGEFNKSEIEKLRALLGTLEKPSGPGFGEDDWTC
ncbi:Endonuclease [Actinidia chinensis var. chinensis]|uniref:Endonuclease n=1 Tax=Actinidia chinensis var. chinensis TaxID=1590841 RepID=A0A2R6R2G0_ACTCC|nr:Endonuclease [Actinidia chinensis var. chinensis]